MANSEPALRQQVLTIDEAAGKLRLSKSFLYKQTCARAIPFIKIGARVLFLESDLSAWVESKRVPSSIEA
ncbi:MAG TPA: hypothetical protein DCG47_15275 [Spirochaetaceae bacterium]|jgi:excisionase family DNA binding protein|nr:hypothetical protein [Spirochaetaceae bacterium]